MGADRKAGSAAGPMTVPPGSLDTRPRPLQLIGRLGPRRRRGWTSPPGGRRRRGTPRAVGSRTRLRASRGGVDLSADGYRPAETEEVFRHPTTLRPGPRVSPRAKVRTPTGHLWCQFHRRWDGARDRTAHGLKPTWTGGARLQLQPERPDDVAVRATHRIEINPRTPLSCSRTSDDESGEARSRDMTDHLLSRRTIHEEPVRGVFARPKGARWLAPGGGTRPFRSSGCSPPERGTAAQAAT